MFLFPEEEGGLFRHRTFVVLGFCPEDQKQLQQFILESGGMFKQVWWLKPENDDKFGCLFQKTDKFSGFSDNMVISVEKRNRSVYATN